MATHLILYAHPHNHSFNHAILQQAIHASDAHTVIVRDLYQLNFQPNLSWQEFCDTLNQQYAEEIQIEHQYWQ